MSKLNIEQRNIKSLFSDKNSKFLIPDYQRPYAWTETECQTLWSDIFAFAFPDDDFNNFDHVNDVYFLGPIVMFKNDLGNLEIIDGQQRLTTLMLLLRAFYAKCEYMRDVHTIETGKAIQQCIWISDEFGTPDKNALKINSEVATDEEKEEFKDILINGQAEENAKSKYAVNYRFFQKKIADFINKYPTFFAYMPTRILNNCVLLPIEAENQDTALRIFSTLNDRGMPLSDADIFKAQFYKYYSKQNKKHWFISEWKTLEALCKDIFRPISGTPMDELFTRYMYYERALQGIKSSTTESLRKFYEKNAYSMLQQEKTFSNINELAQFWKAVQAQDEEIFSQDVLKRLFVLNYAPNGMWTYIVSVYFMAKKDHAGRVNNAQLCVFLDKITAFIWAYAITNPGVNALRTPLYAEMLNIINDNPLEFKDYLFDERHLKNALLNYKFNNRRAITKSLLIWWAFRDDKQEIWSFENVLEIEHIYAKKRYELEKNLANENVLDSLGNKAILEKRINIKASDYRFRDKAKYYKGFITNRQTKRIGTKNRELIKLADEKNDFLEVDISHRHDMIIAKFIKYVADNGLLKKDILLPLRNEVFD